MLCAWALARSLSPPYADLETKMVEFVRTVFNMKEEYFPIQAQVPTYCKKDKDGNPAPFDYTDGEGRGAFNGKIIILDDYIY